MSIFDDDKYGHLYDIKPIKPLFEPPKPDIKFNKTLDSYLDAHRRYIDSSLPYGPKPDPFHDNPYDPFKK